MNKRWLWSTRAFLSRLVRFRIKRVHIISNRIRVGRRIKNSATELKTLFFKLWKLAWHFPNFGAPPLNPSYLEKVQLVHFLPNSPSCLSVDWNIWGVILLNENDLFTPVGVGWRRKASGGVWGSILFISSSLFVDKIHGSKIFNYTQLPARKLRKKDGISVMRATQDY